MLYKLLSERLAGLGSMAGTAALSHNLGERA